MKLLRFKNIVFLGLIIYLMSVFLVSFINYSNGSLGQETAISSGHLDHSEKVMGDCLQTNCSTMASNAHCSACFSLPPVISVVLTLPQKSEDIPQKDEHWQSIALDPEIRPPIYS